MFMMLGTGLQGRTLGIVGMGAIGEALAASRTGVRDADRVPQPQAGGARDRERLGGARLLDLDELLATSDVVSINCPYSEATHHLIDVDALARMKPTAYPRQHGTRADRRRGGARRRAPRRRRSPVPRSTCSRTSPRSTPACSDLDNVVLVPHLGSATVETRSAMARLAADNVVEVLAGRSPLTPVN